MSSTGKPLIAVCGTVAQAVDEVVGLVKQTAQFEAIPVCWPNRPGLSAAQSRPVSGFVLVAASGTASEELAAELAAGHGAVPLVVIGGDRPPATSTCWLARPPPRGVFGILLAQLIPTGTTRSAPAPVESEPPPSRSWRRKSDMIVGISAAVTRLLAALDRLAPAAAPVLITGESGTGKELVARALHYSGKRATAPFIAINCGAIPGPLFEAELFGYQRGAFTGAVAARPGAFEAADGGTLFLDEIGEMPVALQVKLLRVLETGEVTRLGSNESRRMQVRLVAATNRNLHAEVAASRFREDLYYRVSVYPVHIPPLRERPEDIPPIVVHHLEEIARRERRGVPRLTHAALEKLLSHRWPGNVRELINALERAILLAEEGTVDAHHIVLPEESPQPLILAYRDAKEKFEHDYYAQILRTAGGNITLVARLAQKTRKEVYDALRRLGLDAVEYRESSGHMKVARPVTSETKSGGPS